ncbi:putative late blight resistance protein homolog R1A-10 [Solanum stenotomum]|uniref:putative late blight resistance protein homolog R1A-10 n=1 Tax=Solanum stenotomum TaxID=172797 RepID=UPI0020D10108|nr:putative late blight resistance protein homolog R1A-10 [Solanum stenotomum]
MQRTFSNDDNRSRILLTTRFKYVADCVSYPDFPPHIKSFLSLNDSWNLFTEKLFKKDPCPPHLEETGKHIVQQCQGLPLSVVVIAGLACFLYVGGFPEDREINVSRLIRLWIAEQFVKARNNKRLEVVAEEYLQELIDRSLILIGRQSANGRMRSCKIHDLLRQLCLSEAHTENVVHIMNGNVPMFLLEAIDDQRRVILLSKLEQKQVYPPMHSNEELETLVIKLENIDVNIFSVDILSCKIKKLSPNIKKLILLGTYVPWEVVNLLANLPNLEVIKGEYAFSGTDWKVDEDVVFRKLKYLLICEADLERWEVGSDNFPMLEQLLLDRLYELEEIPGSIGDIMTQKLIKIDDCSSSVENSAKRTWEIMSFNFKLFQRLVKNTKTENR